MASTCMRFLAFVAVASLPLVAQQPASSPPQPTGNPQVATPQQTNPGPGSSGSGHADAVPVPSTANSPEISNNQLRPVAGELVNNLDTKSAKTGDSVIVKTTEKATTANGVEIPKGSKIMGHVTDVEAKGASGENSRVTIQFDQAEIKGGQNLPIRSVIQSVAPAGTGGSAEGAGGPPAPAPSGGSAASGGGAAGSQPSGSSAGSNAGSSAGSTAPAPNASQPASSGPKPSNSAPPAGTVVATKGNIAIRTTAIPGVFLVGSVTGQPFSNAAGALLGAKQDVRLDGGTQMVLAIIPASPAGNVR